MDGMLRVIEQWLNKKQQTAHIHKHIPELIPLSSRGCVGRATAILCKFRPSKRSISSSKKKNGRTCEYATKQFPTPSSTDDMRNQMS
eukprot:m.37415 g.37415  ORF g.37415 m.37415 type:complete len:87 (-) comp10144_c0_seq13:2041-2301(-)